MKCNIYPSQILGKDPAGGQKRQILSKHLAGYATNHIKYSKNILLLNFKIDPNWFTEFTLGDTLGSSQKGGIGCFC